MSQQARLCREIIEEEFGPFVAKVAHQILLKGRLTLPDIVRFTKLTPKQIRESLVVLIQHGLAFFTEAVEGQKEQTHYQVSAEQTLMRLRMPAIMQVAEERWEEIGVDICRLLFIHGRMKIGGVRDWVKGDSKRKDKMDQYIKAFTKMANEHYIIAVLPEHSRSAVDRYLEAEQKESEKYTITTAKEIQAIKKSALESVEAEYGMLENAGLKRKAIDAISSAHKRMAVEIEDMEVDEKIYFHINYERFNILFRNNSVMDYAIERINRTAGQIVKAFFEHGKNKIRSLHENDSPSATPMHIANIIPQDVIDQGDIVLQPDLINPGKKPSVQDIITGYITLLKIDSAGFVRSRDELGSSQYSINFLKLRENMKRKLLEGLVREKMGVATCRILRILIEKGKLDESQVQKLAMLPPKDTREKLALLNLRGFVEIQEVPRTADRAPGRSFHLWYVPLEKIYEELLVDVYRTVANLQQRRRQELKVRSRLLEKLNRQDVKENIDLLGEGDKAEITQMDKVLERIEISKKRLDQMIMILRDF